MSYKTILVHCNDERRLDGLLVAANRQARQSNAHVIGLSVLPEVVMLTEFPDAYIAEMLETEKRAYRTAAGKMKVRFDDAMRGQPFTAEWRQIETATPTVAQEVIEEARAADLVITSQADPAWKQSSIMDVGDRLALESGRPVLLLPLPRNGSPVAPTKFGIRIVVAWNARRESARAVFDALPLLKSADEVKVLWVNPLEGGRREGALPGTDICQALARHGVKSEAATAQTEDRDVGAEILRQVSRLGGDLLVMGAYGHSRFREFILGGASRHVLQNATVPVLLSH